MAELDIQIKNGTVVDGTRSALPRDVWIKDGRSHNRGRAPGFASK